MPKIIRRILGLTIMGFLVFLAFVIFISVKNQRIHNIIRTAEQKYSDEGFFRTLNYKLYFSNIPLGYLMLEVRQAQYKNSDVYQAHLSIRPENLFRNISWDNLGADFETVIDKDSLLPYRFEQNNLYNVKRGRKAKNIAFHHDDLLMKLRGNSEDIEEDTRDPVSLLLWLMVQDYENLKLIKSTLTIIDGTMFLIVGKVKDVRSPNGSPPDSRLVQLKLKILQINKTFDVVNHWPMTIYLIKKGKVYLPILFDVEKRFLRITIVLNERTKR